MKTLRIAGVALFMALFMVMALFTTGAFAQGARVSQAGQSVVVQKAATVHTQAVRPFARFRATRFGGFRRFGFRRFGFGNFGFGNFGFNRFAFSPFSFAGCCDCFSSCFFSNCGFGWW